MEKIKKLEKELHQAKRIIQELKKSEERYKAIFDHLNVGVYRTSADPEGKFIEVNPALARILGFDNKKVKERTKELVEAEERFRNLFHYVSEGIVVLDNLGRFKLINKQAEEISGYTNEELKGKLIPIEIMAGSVPFVEKGKDNGIIITVQDITERKKAYQALEESEEKYRTIVENINIGIYRASIDLDGKFLEVNEAMVKMFGCKNKEELLNLKIYDLYQEAKDREKFIQKLRKKWLSEK